MSDKGEVFAIILASITLPIQLTAQTHCPVVGDTVTITGQVSIQEVNGLKLPELHPQTFPNQFQPICILVRPFIAAGGGRVDRAVPGNVHIWLASPKQREANGNIDWAHPEPIATGIFLQMTGKLFGQTANGISSDLLIYYIALEVSDVKNVDAEMKAAVSIWESDCRKWIDAQLTTDAAAAWKYPPRAGERLKIREYYIKPFASYNGLAAPECAASVHPYVGADGGERGKNLARLPYIVNNLGGISFSESTNR